MFWIFKNKNQTERTSKGVAVKPSKNKIERKLPETELDREDLLSAIGSLEKQLRELKGRLAETGARPAAETATTDTAIQQALAQVKERDGAVVKNGNERVIEGVFDGQAMVGADGEVYDVPANYASKSKLVEGDILKLTINNLGAFVYKQIKPIDRARKVGVLEQDPQNLQFYAAADGKRWRLLTASVTYYKGEPGDEVVFLIPAEGGSRSAAVENIIRAE